MITSYRHRLELLGTAQGGLCVPRKMKYLILWFHKIFQLTNVLSFICFKVHIYTNGLSKGTTVNVCVPQTVSVGLRDLLLGWSGLFFFYVCHKNKSQSLISSEYIRSSLQSFCLQYFHWWCVFQGVISRTFINFLWSSSCLCWLFVCYIRKSNSSYFQNLLPIKPIAFFLS